MEASKVFFTDMRCSIGTSLLDKMDKLMLAAGIEQINFQNAFVAIKLHFGEPGSTSANPATWPFCDPISLKPWQTG